MNEHGENPSFGEMAMEMVTWSVGLGILTLALFPLSLGGLVLFVIAPVALVFAPIVLIPLLIALLAAPFILLFRLARALTRRSTRGTPRRRAATGGALRGSLTRNQPHPSGRP